MSSSLPFFHEREIMMNALRIRAQAYCEHFGKDTVAEYIHDHCPGEAAEVIRQADLLLENTFVYTNRWDMEPCAVPYTISLEDWVTSSNGDPEWIFMLNRHDFLHKLWQAWVLTGQERYITKLRYFLLDWIAKNPITEQGTDATRTIDTGIRCMNWSVILLHLMGEGLIEDQDARIVLNSLSDQCQNMRLRYIGKYDLSNWGVLQTTAICAAHLWYPEYVSREIAVWAWDTLQTQLSLQILSDGSHWEQSPMYHVEVLNTSAKLLTQLQTAKALGISMVEFARNAMGSDNGWKDEHEAMCGPGEGYEADQFGWLSDAVRVLSRHVLYTADPSLHQLPIGDSDVTDVRDVLARATVLLSGSGIYRYGAGAWMDLDSVFELGSQGIRAFHEKAPLVPIRTVWSCHDSGNFCYRTSWDADASFTAMKCGTLGSSHGHADQTQLMLHYKGKPFLIDSGRYTYVEEDPLRPLLKKPFAHNVCVIDGWSGGEPNGSWSYHRYDETLKNYDRHQDGVHFTQMGFHGVLEDGTPYLVQRRVMAIDSGIWLSSQDVICQGEHEVQEYFHLHEDVAVEVEQGSAALRNGSAVLKLLTDEELILRKGIVSDKYNEKHTAPILIRGSRMRDRMTTFTVIADAEYHVNSVPVYQMRRAEPVSAETAAAWDVVKPDGTKYTLILWNRETCRGDKLFSCHGVSVYGKAVVLAWEGDQCRTIRLKV